MGDIDFQVAIVFAAFNELSVLPYFGCIEMGNKLAVRVGYTGRWCTQAAARVGMVGLAIAVALGLTSGWLSDLLQFDGSTSILVVGSAIVLMLISIVVKGALAGTSSFLFLGLISVAETASRLGAGAGMVLLGWAAAGAVAGSTVGASVAIVGGAIFLFRVTRRAHSSEPAEGSEEHTSRERV